MVLYIRIPSAIPQMWMISSLDIRSKSAPVKWVKVEMCWPNRWWFIHFDSWLGVESLTMFGVCSKNKTYIRNEHKAILTETLTYSSASTCCGDKAFWSILTFELDDDTLLIPIGLLVFVLNIMLSNLFTTGTGEWTLSGEVFPDCPATLRIIKQNYIDNFNIKLTFSLLFFIAQVILISVICIQFLIRLKDYIYVAQTDYAVKGCGF